MNSTTATVAAPKLPSADTMSDPRCSVIDASGRFLVTFCPVNGVGGIYTFETMRWQLLTGISFLEFAAMLGLSGVNLDDCEASRTWFEHCNVAASVPAGSC